MIESLVVISCLFGNIDGCYKSTEAYYKEKKIDLMLERVRSEYPTADNISTVVLTSISIYKDKKFIVPFYNQGKNHYTYSQNLDSIMLTWKLDL